MTIVIRLQYFLFFLYTLLLAITTTIVVYYCYYYYHYHYHNTEKKEWRGSFWFGLIAIAKISVESNQMTPAIKPGQPMKPMVNGRDRERG